MSGLITKQSSQFQTLNNYKFSNLDKCDLFPVKKPSKVTYADAACCVGNGLQAFTALHYKANLCGGETVLVMNGASV